MNLIIKDPPVIFEFQGQKFAAGGTMMDEEYLSGCYLGPTDMRREYVGATGDLESGHGKKIGTYKIMAIWKTPKSYISHIMCQVEVEVQGRHYTGRSAGVGMHFRGKRVAEESK